MTEDASRAPRYRLVERHPRPGQLDFYGEHPYPFYSITWDAAVDVARDFAHEHSYSTHFTLCYLVTRAMQAIEDFRYGWIGEDLVLFDHLIVGSTVPTPDGQFAFGDFGWDDDVHAFLDGVAAASEGAVSLEGALRDSGRPDMVLCTAIPGVRFTGLTHVPPRSPRDARNRVAFGAFFRSEGRLRVPIAVQVHHGFVGGRALGELAAGLELCLERPEAGA